MVVRLMNYQLRMRNLRLQYVRLQLGGINLLHVPELVDGRSILC